MLEISKKVFNLWNDNDVLYCHWKSNEHLVPGLNGETDLDVLMDEKDANLGCAIMRDLNFLKCKSQYASRYPFVQDWIGFDEQTGALIHIHLHFKAITGHEGMKEYTLPWSELALSTRVLDTETNVYIMEPNLELVTLYSRIGLKATFESLEHAKKQLFKLDKANMSEIAYLKERVEWGAIDKIVDEFFHNQKAEILKIMKAEIISSNLYIALHNCVTKAMADHRRVKGLSCFVTKWYYQAAIRIIPRYKKYLNNILITRKTPHGGTGLVIAFIGQDGAGKSTVTKIIEKWLLWKIETKQFYLGSGDHFEPWEKKVQRKLQSHNSLFFKIIRGWLPLRLYSKLASQVYGTIKNANKYKRNGGIAIFDRYPQVQFEGINDSPKIKSVLMKKIPGIIKPIAKIYAREEERLIHKAVVNIPDVVIKLTLTPEESLRRKPHEDYEGVKKKHEIIKKLKFDGARVYEVDAAQDFEKEIILIKNIIWNNIPK